MGEVTVIRPCREGLPGYLDALRRGWSPVTQDGEAAARAEEEWILRDPEGFLASRDNPEARGGPITLADGSRAPRVPAVQRWIWDGEFCGTVSLRWMPGTDDLPEHVLGHVGYSVAEWKRGRGCAREAVRQVLPLARAVGLTVVRITTDPGNLASRKVIAAVGGVPEGSFEKPLALGGGEGLAFTLPLPGA